MTSRVKNGGEAFPTKHGHLGMTLRDWFAGQALACIPLNYITSPNEAKMAAESAYMIADAMFAARGDP